MGLIHNIPPYIGEYCDIRSFDCCVLSFGASILSCPAPCSPPCVCDILHINCCELALARSPFPHSFSHKFVVQRMPSMGTTPSKGNASGDDLDCEEGGWSLVKMRQIVAGRWRIGFSGRRHCDCPSSEVARYSRCQHMCDGRTRLGWLGPGQATRLSRSWLDELSLGLENEDSVAC